MDTRRSGDGIGDLANAAKQKWSESGALPHGLIELRSCLFFEQRRYRHFGWDPDEDSMVYIRALIEAIRARVAETNPETAQRGDNETKAGP